MSSQPSPPVRPSLGAKPHLWDRKSSAPSREIEFSVRNGAPLDIPPGDYFLDVADPDRLQSIEAQDPLAESKRSNPPPEQPAIGRPYAYAGLASSSHVLDPDVEADPDGPPEREPPRESKRNPRLGDLELARSLSDLQLSKNEHQKQIDQLVAELQTEANQLAGTGGAAKKAALTGLMMALGSVRDFLANGTGQAARHATTQGLIVMGGLTGAAPVAASGIAVGAIVTAGLTIGHKAAVAFTDANERYLDKDSAFTRLLHFLPALSAVTAAVGALVSSGSTRAIEMLAEVVGRLVGNLVRDTISQLAAHVLPSVMFRRKDENGELVEYTPEEARNRDFWHKFCAAGGYTAYYAAGYVPVADAIQASIFGDAKAPPPDAGFLERWASKTGTIFTSNVLETGDAAQLGALYGAVFEEMSLAPSTEWRGARDLYTRIAGNAGMRWNISLFTGIADVIGRHHKGEALGHAMAAATWVMAYVSEFRGYWWGHGSATQQRRENNEIELRYGAGSASLEVHHVAPRVASDALLLERARAGMRPIGAPIEVNDISCKVCTSFEDWRQEREAIEVDSRHYNRLVRTLNARGGPETILKAFPPGDGPTGQLLVHRDFYSRAAPGLTIRDLPRPQRGQVRGDAPQVDDVLFFPEQSFTYRGVRCKVTKIDSDSDGRYVRFLAGKKIQNERPEFRVYDAGALKGYLYRMDEKYLRKQGAYPYNFLVTPLLHRGVRLIIGGHHCVVRDFGEPAGLASHGPRITVTSSLPIDALENARRESGTKRRVLTPQVGDKSRLMYAYELTPDAFESTKPLIFDGGEFLLGGQKVTVKEDRRTGSTVFSCEHENSVLAAIFPEVPAEVVRHEGSPDTFSFKVSSQLLRNELTLQRLESAMSPCDEAVPAAGPVAVPVAVPGAGPADAAAVASRGRRLRYARMDGHPVQGRDSKYAQEPRYFTFADAAASQHPSPSGSSSSGEQPAAPLPAGSKALPRSYRYASPDGPISDFEVSDGNFLRGPSAASSSAGSVTPASVPSDAPSSIDSRSSQEARGDEAPAIPAPGTPLQAPHT